MPSLLSTQNQRLVRRKSKNLLLRQMITEAAKFGEDVKYLADVTNSTKKFDPWIAK